MLTIEELVDELRSVSWYPDPHDFASLAFTDLLSVGSERFTPAEWIAIAGLVRDAVAEEGVDGVVITHGTFTAEETAYFLHLTANTRKPIVLVCSQRPHGTIGNDGDRNLVDAIRFAAESTASGLGVVLVINEEIHSARGVVKTNGRPDGFASPNGGMLGLVYSDRIAIYKEPHRRHTHLSEFSVPSSIPRVDVVATYAGADGVTVDALVQNGATGLVVSGFSFNGMPHHLQADALHAAVAGGIPVVVVNRGGRGRIAPDRYNEGFIRGDDLTAQQARVLLGVALSHGVELGDLQRVFDEY
jgi:L-asparaginase/Glu-tRNA(Gln) amidotransferase subunit D